MYFDDTLSASIRRAKRFSDDCLVSTCTLLVYNNGDSGGLGALRIFDQALSVLILVHTTRNAHVDDEVKDV
ncbi:hypothetical protein EGYY_18810 [Eggerthella sp. YY7918]|nr:hypothetical protein EGYY_18810 [Eggerthella sp. YY7918]